MKARGEFAKKRAFYQWRQERHTRILAAVKRANETGAASLHLDGLDVELAPAEGAWRGGDRFIALVKTRRLWVCIAYCNLKDAGSAELLSPHARGRHVQLQERDVLAHVTNLDPYKTEWTEKIR